MILGGDKTNMTIEAGNYHGRTDKKERYVLMKKRWLFVLLLGMIFGTGCAGTAKNEKLEIVKYNCVIEDELAQSIAARMKNTLQSYQEGIVQIDNFSFLFQGLDLDALSTDWKGYIHMRVYVTADYELIREPKDSPMIQGMYEAKNELETDEQKEQAQNIIDEYITSMQEEGKKKRNMEFASVVIYSEDNISIEYDKYHEKEREEIKREQGYKIIYERLHIEG